MDYKEGLLKNSRLTETQLLNLTKAVFMAAQQDMYATNGKGFHLLEGTVRVQPDGTYIFKPSKVFKQLLEQSDYPAVLKIEEQRLLKWILAILEYRDDG